MEKYKVYAHLNKNNGKAYIGISKQKLEHRWGNQGQGYKAQPKFYNAIQKYGWNNFEHYNLAEDIETEEEALDLETYYINQYNSIENGYNVLEHGIQSYPRFKPVYCETTQTKYNSIKEAAEQNDCLPTQIIENCKGKRGPVKGLQWTYWDKENNIPYPTIPFKPKPQPNSTRIYCPELNQYYDSINEASRILGIDKRGLQKALNQERIGIQNKHFIRETEIEKLKDIITKDTGKTKKVFCEETKQIFNSQQEAAQFCGKSAQSIMKNCQGKLKSCGKYHFKYVCDMKPDIILQIYQGGIEENGEDN